MKGNHKREFYLRLTLTAIKCLVPDVEREYAFDARPSDKWARPKLPRAWRFDIAIPSKKIAIEIEGLGGRHQTIGGFLGDLEKYTEAFAQGWNVLRVSWAMIEDGRAFEALRRGIKFGSMVEPAGTASRWPTAPAPPGPTRAGGKAGKR